MTRASFDPLVASVLTRTLTRTLARSTALALIVATPLTPLSAQFIAAPRIESPRTNGTRDAADPTRFSENELDNLVGAIALYPDALLAQVLVAATFPDQVNDAALWVREHGTDGIDEQSWDVSVKSVAHYQSALNMMADKGDWTATLGRAYAFQSSDVMAAVQRMRRLADAQGNLVSTPQQQVVRESDNYVIVPAQPRVIYVPVYDPVVVYRRPIFGLGFSSALWSYGVGFPIGGWLNYDLDWGRRAVYYNGWDNAYFAYGGGWRARSRPFIQVTNIYVNPRYRNVFVNRDVAYRPVNYRNVDRYAGYHRDVAFVSRRDGYRENSRDGRTHGRNDGGNRDVRFDGQAGRTAQSRSSGTSASPDGYRNNNQAPREVRREVGRDASREVRRDTPRSQPSSSESRAPAPRASAPRASTARASESRASESRGATTRSAKPRGSGDARGGGRP